MSDVVKPHVLRYRDAEGVDREMPDPDFPWYGERGTLKAIATTQDGVTSMLDRMEVAHAS